MTSVTTNDVRLYVRQNIGSFHTAKLDKLMSLKLSEVLRKKNPYLFKAKDITLAQDLVTTLLDAYLSSQEEAMFGDFLEGLAIFVCKSAYGGWKSAAQGVDLEFDKDGIRYVLTVKSGPNWGNSGQVREMRDNFRKAKQILRTSDSHLHVVAINGCCYGRNTKPDKGDYYKYCGQAFWEFISGNLELYLEIIEPLGYTAKERNTAFHKQYSRIVNMFATEFSQTYVTNGEIDWNALVRFNSSSGKPEAKRKANAGT